jgi:hypothetical protein
MAVAGRREAATGCPKRISGGFAENLLTYQGPSVPKNSSAWFAHANVAVALSSLQRRPSPRQDHYLFWLPASALWRGLPIARNAMRLLSSVDAMEAKQRDQVGRQPIGSVGEGGLALRA